MTKLFKQKPVLTGSVVLLLSGIFSSTINAHHSLAQFDTSQATSISGVVERVWFNNPHVRYYVTVTDEAGEEKVWDVHTSSVNILVRRGWTADSIKAGDEVTLYGNPTRDGSLEMLIHTVELTDGSRLSTRDPGIKP